MKYPAVRHHLNGSFVLDDLSTIEVFDRARAASSPAFRSPPGWMS